MAQPELSASLGLSFIFGNGKSLASAQAMPEPVVKALGVAGHMPPRKLCRLLSPLSTSYLVVTLYFNTYNILPLMLNKRLTDLCQTSNSASTLGHNPDGHAVRGQALHAGDVVDGAGEHKSDTRLDQFLQAQAAHRALRTSVLTFSTVLGRFVTTTPKKYDLKAASRAYVGSGTRASMSPSRNQGDRRNVNQVYFVRFVGLGALRASLHVSRFRWASKPRTSRTGLIRPW